MNFPFYLGGGSFLGSSVTPVRRREDTDRDGDAGVKVQIDDFEGALTLFYRGQSRVKTDFGEKSFLEGKSEQRRGVLGYCCTGQDKYDLD
jgi:hypothetical protein